MQPLAVNFNKIQQLTAIISKAQSEFIIEDDRRKAFDTLLADILTLMESEYGFIGEVLYDEHQAPYLKSYALTNIAWNESTHFFYQQHAPSGLEFRNLNTLFGYTLRSGQVMRTNAPAQEQEAGGIPHGHPPLKAYLGLPVFYHGQLIAMLGLANKAGGYLAEDTDFLKPLLNTIGQLVFASRVRSQQTETQQQLNNTIDASQIGTWTLDLSTNRLVVNARWLEMLGYRPEEIEPLTVEWMRLQMHPDDLVRSRASMLQHVQGEHEYYFSQFRIKHKNGHWVWVQARGKLLTCPLKPGQQLTGTLYGISIDITEQKNTEQKLTKLAEHVPGLVYQFQKLKDGRVIFPYVGPAAEDILGFTPEQLLSDGSQVFSKVHPDDYPALMLSVAGSANSLTLWRHTFRLSVDGCHFKWLAAHSSPELMPDGSVLWHGYIHDVTDEVILQQELKRAKEHAEHAAAIKSSFLANMSHEIRTPMNGVIGMLDVLAESNLDPGQIENINLMRESAYSLLTIIDDILDFSKLESGKLSILPVRVNVSDTLDKICSMVDFLALKSDVDFYYYLDPKIPVELELDPDRLRQVLINLLSNAIKFSSKTQRKGQVYLKATLLDSQYKRYQVEFKISDNGIGMSPVVLESLFQPFTQADPSTSRKYGGTGLGLAISQQLVHLMGGQIKAESELDIGSDFSFTIKLSNTSEEQCATSQLSGCRIMMLVDPAQMLMRHLAAYLEAEGASVHWFALSELMQLVEEPFLGKVLWVFDEVYSSGEVISAAEMIKQYWPEQSRFLVTGRGRRRKARRTSADTVYLDLNALSRKQLVTAVQSAFRDEELIVMQTAQTSDNLTLQHPTKILVLEDNSTNQKVIRQQLQRLGYQVTIAENGVQGLAFLKQEQYQLIVSVRRTHLLFAN